MAAPHAFLDILANTHVRDAYLAGRISIILSADIGTVLWTNGAGARFMGFRTVAESINADSGFDRLTCHQIEAGLAGTRPVRIRGIPQSQSFLVNEITLQQLGKVIFLRSVAAAVAEGDVVDLTDGLSDETTEAAVLDLSGRVMRASPDFDPHLLATEELSTLLQEAHRDGEVKKRFLAGDKHLPVGVLQLNADPAIFLLIAAKADPQKNTAPDQQVFVFDPRRLPVRFVWKTDAEGKFTEVSPELEKNVGRKYADIIGLSFADIAADWNMDRGGAVRTLLKSRNAWSGRTLDWPVADEKTRVSVELAALPFYASDRSFSGFRGFGVINGVARPATVDEAETSGKAARGRLTPQEHEAFSAIGRHLRADIFTVGQHEQAPDLPDASSPPAAAPAVGESAAVPSGAVPSGEGGSDEKQAPATAAAGEERSDGAGVWPPDGSSPLVAAPVPAGGSAAVPSEAGGADEEQAPATAAAGEEHSDGAGVWPPDALSLLNQLPVAVLVYRENRVLFTNRAFLEMTGYACTDAFSRDDVLADVLATWIPQKILRLESGETMPADITVRPVVWQDGAAAFMASFLCPAHNIAPERADRAGPGPAENIAPEPADNSAAERAEIESLHARSVQLAALLNMISDGIIILDSAGLVASANEAAARMFGYSPADMKGQLFSRFFAEKSLEAIRLGFQAARQESTPLVAGESREAEGLTARGDAMRLRINFGRMGFDDAYFLIVRDLTRFHAIVADLIRARREAEEEVQRKSHYLALVSHEVRTPVNAVIGLSQLMLEEKHGPLPHDRYREYLGDIIRSGEHVMSLTRDLLQTAKNAEGWPKPEIMPVSLPAILNEVLALMMPQANKNRIIIRSGLAADLSPVAADARSVRQIFFNLLSNAIRFTPQGGQIVISACHSGPDEVLLRIRDTGMGMSRQELEEAMRPYRQVAGRDVAADSDTNRQTGSGGTGLGLPLTKALAEMNGARFMLHSEPGKGTIAEVAFVAAGRTAAAAS